MKSRSNFDFLLSFQLLSVLSALNDASAVCFKVPSIPVLLCPFTPGPTPKPVLSPQFSLHLCCCCHVCVFRGHPQGNTSVCKHTFCIVLANRPHGACKRTFFKKPGLREEKPKNVTVAFSRGLQISILCVSMMPSPHPSSASLRPLNPAPSHNNNNGGLHACVRAAEHIERIRVTRAKYCAPLPLR